MSQPPTSQMLTPIKVLSIAGSDSSGGAGIQADLKTFQALGAYGATVITALTAQNTQGVQGIHPIPASFVRDQLDSVLSDVAPQAIKIGMLAQANIIDVVARALTAYLGDHPQTAIILDPVMVATSGDVLLEPSALNAMPQLFGLANAITPNLPELAVLAGHRPDIDLPWLGLARQLIVSTGIRAVLVKGGHAQETREQAGLITDTLVSRGKGSAEGNIEETVYQSPRIHTPHTHGTGCTLSSAMAVMMGRGMALPQAIGAARTYLWRALAAGAAGGIGKGRGPVWHGVSV